MGLLNQRPLHVQGDAGHPVNRVVGKKRTIGKYGALRKRRPHKNLNIFSPFLRKKDNELRIAALKTDPRYLTAAEVDSCREMLQRIGSGGN
jgi:hypothetical protein